MKKNELAKGLPTFAYHLLNCHACQYSKQKRRPFPKSTWKGSHKLHIIHTDVYGTQRTMSLIVSRYYIAFIVDFTTLCWIFFLKFM